jgi:hypothetical protein
MKTAPIDCSRVQFLSSGCVTEHFTWADGKRADSQTYEHGMPVWIVDAFVIGADRGEVAAVKVPAPTRPDVPAGQPVEFERLTMSVYAQKKGRDGVSVQFSYEAAGIRNSGPQRTEKAA